MTRIDMTEAMKVIADLGHNGIYGSLIARFMIGTVSERGKAYAILFLQDPCDYCGKRPDPHLSYEDFCGYNMKPLLLLAHFCDKNGELPNNHYHTFKTIADWEKWNKNAVVAELCRLCKEPTDTHEMVSGMCNNCIKKTIPCKKCELPSDPRDILEDKDGRCYYCQADDASENL